MTDSPYLNPIEVYICMDVFLAFIEWDSEESTGRREQRAKRRLMCFYGRMRRYFSEVQSTLNLRLCRASELVQAACGVTLGPS